ncbi:MAG: thiamine phosphate synthase [Desulfobacterales bacterium]|nr:thiamine phosphate synthase [Desulfobacterales bacterium]MDD4073838.1 thiamine phosphate synthase [Desulfobacterales bacterium]MDD4393381.1 thiamine phosphate synthase [Desulfobacterales bacterium]
MKHRSAIFNTDRSDIYYFADNIALCRRLLDSGAKIIQLREKTIDDHAFHDLASEMLALVNRYENAALIINDRVDIAMDIHAHGIHIGQGDESFQEVISRVPDDMVVGVSVGNVEEALAAERFGAGYIGAGAIFPTASKSDASVIGIEMLRQIVSCSDIPVVAIGGITKDNIVQVRDAGAHYFAMISEVNDSADISARINELLSLIGSR